MKAIAGTHPPRFVAALELLLILAWTLVVGRAYLDMDPRQWPTGREFGMAIQPHFAWTRLAECGACMLWNGDWNGGSPTFAELHAAVAHPLVIVATLLYGAINGAKVVLLGSLYMAGVAQWWMGRTMRLGTVPRLWAAAMAVAAGNLAGRMEHGTVGLVLSTAAASLALAAALKLAKTGHRRDTVLLAVTLALALVAGQGYLQVGLFLGILPLLAVLLVSRRGKVRPHWREFALALGLGLLLAAVFLVPMIHFWPNFNKDLDPYFQSSQPLQFVPLNYVIGDVNFYQETALGKLPFGYLYMNYIGWIPVLLAILALRLVPRRGRRLLTFFCLGIGAAILLGSGVPFKALAKVAPEMVTGLRSSPVLAGLAVPFLLALAAWALDELMKRNWPALSIELPNQETRLRLSLMVPAVGLLLLLSLRSEYLFARAWLRSLPQPDYSYAVARALRTDSAQWVALPYGEHMWPPLAGEVGLKLTLQVRPAHWRDRELPPPLLQAWRETGNSAEPWQMVEGIPIIRLPENEYAAVTPPSVPPGGGEAAAADGSGPDESGLEAVPPSEGSGLDAAAWAAAEPPGIPCRARARGGDIDVVCDAPAGGTLVVRENAWSGWRLRIDGQPARLAMVGQWLGAEALPGQHVYQFRYRPWDVPLGAALTLVGVGIAVLLWWPGLGTRLRARLRRRGAETGEAPIEAVD